MARNLSSLVCAVSLLALTSGCNRNQSNSAPASGGGYFQPQFQTEAQFVVESIVSDLTEQMYFAKFHRLPEKKYFSVVSSEIGGTPDEPEYQLRIRLDSKIKELTTQLKIDGPIWSPAVYRSLADELAKAMDLAPTASTKSDDTTLLAKLLDGAPETIEQQNQDLSEALEGDFTNPELHEKAALLLGAFVLREHSGYFFEIRSPLSRLAAHLTMAQFLRGAESFSINGRMAEAIMLTAAGDEAQAVEHMRSMDTNDAPVAAMVRGLRARNTRDYRELATETDRSAFETIQWFYAMACSLGTPLAWPKLSEEQKKSIDFVRIANDMGYSVEIGHELLDVSGPLEMKEIKSIYELAHTGKTLPSDVSKVLNEFPEHCLLASANGNVQVHVIGWGQWAMFLQRQLCHAVQQNYYLMNGMWGVPDEAKEFAARCDQAFGGLTLYPFVRRFNCSDVDCYHKAVDDGFKLTVSMPQYVPAYCWNYLCWSVNYAPAYNPNPNPHVNEWHNHNPLPGTVYDMNPRYYHPSLTGRGDAMAKFEKLHELAPYNVGISVYIMKHKYNDKATFDQAMALYHDLIAYSPGAVRGVANTVEDQPVRFEPLMKQAAEMDPLNYYYLANYMRNRNEEKKAAEYFEKMFEKDPDRVRVSNSMQWLVRYLLKNGEKARAAEIAADAGSSYSFGGLETQAMFFEETSNYDEAFKWFAAIDERYNGAAPVLEFCFRYKEDTGSTRFDSEVQKRVNKLFPKGVEKASLADFKSSPNDGVVFLQQNALMESHGLKKGDVIVAVNGMRVHDVTQYMYGRNLKSSLELNLIVWQGDGYHEVTVSPAKHRFGVNIDTYAPQRGQ